MIPDESEIDWGPRRKELQEDEPCPECYFPFVPRLWPVRHLHGGPSVGESWIYTCPYCLQETCVIRT